MEQLPTIYNTLVEKGQIARDLAQEKIVNALETLRQRIHGYSLPSHTSLLKRMIGKGKSTIPSPQGIYLYGEVGRGKSMLMDMFFANTDVPRKRRVHFHAFMIEIHAELHRWRQEQKDNPKAKDPIPPLAKKIAEQSALLCFDEFHVTDIADAMLLGRLFTELFALGVVVVATSNRHPDELYKDGLQREHFLPFIALIKEKLLVLSLDAQKDYRLERIKSLKTLYYTPLDKGAKQFMETTFASLTNHASPIPTTLHMQGRELLLPKTAGGVAMASFHDLCEAALGSADYLEIAQEFNVLLLSDIPILTPDLRNEAKRFVTLVDALYEHRVKLICTAAASPNQLYIQGHGAFEFERTVSRLMEMQSENYWQGEHS
ncbi:MAG: ATPase [Rickettsiales bacterium]|jgi:cell division protein ZapE|nr:ATPase [Rickettsiales bacterium]